MALIKLTQVGARQQASALGRDAQGKPITEINWLNMTDEDMVCKPLYIHDQSIKAITHPNDAIPMVGSVLLTDCFGEIMVLEKPEEVARKVRTYGRDE